MGTTLKLSLEDVELELKIEGYKKDNREYDDWCKVTLSVKSGNWLDYKQDRQEILLSREVDEISNLLEGLINHTEIDGGWLEFVEPDIGLYTYTCNEEDKEVKYILDIELRLWHEKSGALTNNKISLGLLDKDIKKLYNYIQEVRGDL